MCATFFGSVGLKHGHIDNCKRLASCTNNKEVYLTVLHIHARVICSTCGPSRQIWPTLRTMRVMVMRNLSLPLLLTGSVKLVLVNWGFDTQHCSPYTLGS